MEEMFRKTLKEVFQLFLQTDNKQAVQQALMKIKAFSGADRIRLVLFNEENATLQFVEEIAPSADAQLSAFLNTPFQGSGLYFQKDLPWMVRRLKEGKEIVMAQLNDMPWEAFQEKSILSASGARAFYSFPLFRKGKACGFVGLDFFAEQPPLHETEKENLALLIHPLSLYLEKEGAFKDGKKISQQLQQSLTTFRALFDRLQIGVEIYDEKGYLVNINPFALETLGTTEEGVLGINLFDNPNITEEQVEVIQSGKEVTLANEYEFNAVKETEYFITNREDETIHLIGKCIPLREATGRVFGYLLISSQDEGYYMEKETLRISLEKLSLAVNTQDVFFWEYDVKRDRVTVDYGLFDPRRREWVNTVRQMNMTNKISHLQHIHPEDVGRVLQQFNYMLEGELDFFTETYKYQNGNDYSWFTTSFRTYKYNADGKPETIVCLTTDITEQRTNEIELIKAKETNEIKTAFIENMSHEIRTPMNVIVGFSSILAENNDTPENQYLIDLIQRNNEILLRLIEGLLNFTELESETMKYNYEIVDVKTLCEAALEIKSANRKPEIRFHLADDLPSILLHTDRDRLLQVLYQFMENANKYTREGEVTLSYHLDECGQVRVEVSDTGIGMTEAELEKIFSHFYKTDPFQIGVGLGLSIARKIVEDLGGTIGVESEKDKGSTFWFTLPLAAK
ncbi:ATP-binding protein [Parabacteroides sp. PF5-6]|uniref:sensor histidine kinase n=1 Tax=Parabacteroides sp. PF5-6 TaxID=1742403 RepID=UPI00240767E4|nr:ATP-binding protein [Parabacteroides sp. PF5-6]MDF9831769.1 PAS domain S-box-containing protein [Parabacteroides sp. PF5-6]